MFVLIKVSFSIVNSSKNIGNRTIYNPKIEEIKKYDRQNVTGFPNGFLGPIGPQGLPGANGEDGPKGDQGVAGPKGDQGVAGPKGDQGVAGLNGDQGVAGLNGDQGVAGLKGDQGVAGLKGDQGVAGLKGDQGVAGPKGDQGVAGPKGDQGPKGVDGKQGAIGPVGPSRDIVYSINTDTKLGVNDNVQFTNNAVVVGNNISIPEIGKVVCLGGHVYRLCVKWQDNREIIDGEISWSTVDNVLVGTKIGVVANGFLEVVVNPSENTTYIVKKLSGNFQPEKEYSYVIIECLK